MVGCMRKRLTKRNAVILVVVLGLVGWWGFRSNAAKSEVKVKTAVVTRGDVAQTIVATGKIAAGKQVTLNFPASGKLAYLNAHEGDMVSRGQVLAGLDLGDAQAAQTAAYYKYLAADANAKQVEDEVKGHDSGETFTQKNERVAAQTARDIAYDTWLSAQRAVRNANLVAPFAGVVTGVTVSSVGDTVGITDGVTIVDPTSLYFASEIDESDIHYLSIGKSVEIKLDAYPSMEFDGQVSSIAFEATFSSSGATVYVVKMSVPAADLATFRIGMNGDVTMVVNQAQHVLLVPADAVVGDELTVVSGGKMEKRKVTVGVSSDTQTEVAGDIKEGETVWIK